MLKVKHFGDDNIQIFTWENESDPETGHFHNRVAIRFDKQFLSLKDSLRFSNDLFAAMNYAKQEEERLGITHEKTIDQETHI